MRLPTLWLSLFFSASALSGLASQNRWQEAERRLALFDIKKVASQARLHEGEVLLTFQTRFRLPGPSPRTVGFFFNQTSECLYPDSGGCAVTVPGRQMVNQRRSRLEFQWTARALKNEPGPDLVVLESGNANGPEAFGLAVLEKGATRYSFYRYEFVDYYSNSKQFFLTAYDFSDFGLKPGAEVSHVRIVNLFNYASTGWGDRVDSPTGEGRLVFEGEPGLGHAFVGGPLASFTLYPNSKLDPDILLVAGVRR